MPVGVDCILGDCKLWVPLVRENDSGWTFYHVHIQLRLCILEENIIVVVVVVVVVVDK